MDQNNNPDELIEIKPDRIPEEEENDIKIYGSEFEDFTAPVSDTPAATEPEPEAEEVSEDAPAPAEPVEAVESEPTPVIEEEIDDFAEDLAEMENEEADMEMVEAIGDSIVQQVNSEIENSMIMMPDISAAEPQEGLETTGGGDDGGDDDEPERKGGIAGFFARIPWWGYMVAGVTLVLVIMLIWIMTSGPGKGLLVKWGSKYAADKITYAPVQPVDETDVTDESDLPLEPDKNDIEVVEGDHTVITPDISPTEIPAEGDEDPENAVLKDVYNILLIGEENIGGGSARGRSDLLMIASINRKQKSIKLTSIMRDCLVAIPGHIDNRINVAYTIGGVSLLYDTLRTNLGVEIDSYMLVNFDNFENIVDALGGVDVTLTAQEADYLNTTNYISKPEYRNVRIGANHLNGNQVLGYCRIRNVGTASGEFSDFGRTSRQRAILNKIYSTLTDKNYFELLGLANRCLQYVTTDLTAEDIEKYVGMLMEVGMNSGIQNYRIPVSGTFSEALLREMIVTKIDLEANSKALLEFIYGPQSD
ncbi:MAG: LCP family protein [Lachnospiraceae bacterium]|nr:LCP family protein [Lachnospiraceae bacterium]